MNHNSGLLYLAILVSPIQLDGVANKFNIHAIVCITLPCHCYWMGYTVHSCIIVNTQLALVFLVAQQDSRILLETINEYVACSIVFVACSSGCGSTLTREGF